MPIKEQKENALSYRYIYIYTIMKVSKNLRVSECVELPHSGLVSKTSCFSKMIHFGKLNSVHSKRGWPAFNSFTVWSNHQNNPLPYPKLT